MIAFFENGKFEVNDYSDPDLDLYRIGGSAIEGLDSEVLFDPLYWVLLKQPLLNP